MDSLLTVDNLQVQFNTKKGINTAVDGISFSIGKGEILGIVGESGCGKSVTSLSILRLLGTNARISQGVLSWKAGSCSPCLKMICVRSGAMRSP